MQTPLRRLRVSGTFDAMITTSFRLQQGLSYPTISSSEDFRNNVAFSSKKAIRGALRK
jgi:hypothetical protein